MIRFGINGNSGTASTGAWEQQWLATRRPVHLLSERPLATHDVGLKGHLTHKDNDF